MTTTTILADIAATSLVAVRTLERYGLDYCCGGKQAIGDACSAKGLDATAVMQEIEQSLNKGGVQTWMLMASVETCLAGHHEAAVPGAVLSGLLFAGSALLLRYVNRLDRQTRDQF